VNIYEWGASSLYGTADQTHLDAITAGSGQGVLSALQPLLNMQYFGITADSYFSLAEYQNKAGITGNSSEVSKIWGIVLDMGGATNNVRPQYQGLSLVNQSIIGPMYSCSVTNNPTWNFPALQGSTTRGSLNGSDSSGTPNMNSVPYLYSFCFMNGGRRSMVVVNTDLSNSYPVNFGGTNAPTGTVQVRQFAPGSPDLLNEAPSGSPSNQSTMATEVTKNSITVAGL
jgi:hypothetical protein